MSNTDKLKELVKQGNRLKILFSKAYSDGDDDTGMKYEREYSKLRIDIIDLVTQDMEKRKSVPFDVIKREVAAMPVIKPRETGIRSLDYELVRESDLKYRKVGGFPLGVFVQIAGVKGSGKTSLLLRIISGFSYGDPVSWFDFEIGKVSSVEKLEAFDFVDTNLLYYNGSRELEDIINEIKILYAEGVRHFVIDSNMKIKVPSAYSDVNRNSIISDALSELTSSLHINIYLINQVSQQSEREGSLHLKNGNDAEYDADIILYLLKARLLDENKKLVLDESGQPMWDETARYIKCAKNRPYDRLFTVKINKEEIFTKPEIVYENGAA